MARSLPTAQNRMNTTMLKATTVGPTGVPASILVTPPNTEQKREMPTELIITVKKDLNTLMEESAGKMMRAEISRAPTIFMAMTITTPVVMASRVL